MSGLLDTRFRVCIRAGAVAMVAALACAAKPDSHGASGSPGATAAAQPVAIPEAPRPSTLGLEIDPPGALRGKPYRGTLRGPTGEAVFAGSTAVRLRALRPEALAGLRITSRTDAELRIECRVTDTAADTEALFVGVEAGESGQEVSVLLRTVASPWDPAWRPTAVAPADTAVADSTCDVILDVRRSRHPAGLEALHFRWAVDEGSVVIKGGPVTSTRLPAGRHTIVLVAEDALGYVSRDTMRVQVGGARERNR